MLNNQMLICCLVLESILCLVLTIFFSFDCGDATGTYAAIISAKVANPYHVVSTEFNYFSHPRKGTYDFKKEL